MGRRHVQQREEHIKVHMARGCSAYFQKSEGIAETTKAKVRRGENKVRDMKEVRLCKGLQNILSTLLWMALHDWRVLSILMKCTHMNISKKNFKIELWQCYFLYLLWVPYFLLFQNLWQLISSYFILPTYANQNENKK